MHWTALNGLKLRNKNYKKLSRPLFLQDRFSKADFASQPGLTQALCINRSALLTMKKEYESLKHLFQQEFSKMVAVISKLFGLQHIEIAEDIVSETFLLATETWEMKGIPQNPTAWLYTVAKQKTLYHFRRNKILDKKIISELKSTQETTNEIKELDFSMDNIRDSTLQMMFAICNPVIASEAQIALALRILCGFGIDEIAEAFLSNKETINKRLFRAKEKLRDEKIKMELPGENQINNRLNNVLHIIYLLFSEGYYSKTQTEKEYIQEKIDRLL
jgi:RNA polymerase sigma factor (sigma-70 family)